MREEDRQHRLRQALRIDWNDEELLAQALRDQSFVNEHREEHLTSNQKLAFLGDAVLELAVRRHLYETHDATRGDLSAQADKVVCNEQLAKQAKTIQLGPYLSLGNKRIDEKNGKVLARAFEAVLGAVFLDQGFETASAIAMHWLTSDAELDGTPVPKHPDRPPEAV